MVRTRGSTEEAAAGGKRGGGGISARVRSWLFASAAMVTESADIHKDQSGTYAGLRSALCFSLRA